MSETAAPAPPALETEERRAFAKGVSQFNDRLFFECHETLEDVWAGIRGPSRGFIQGLIQAAVAFHHLGNGNRAGARTLLRRAIARLDRYPGRYGGVDLAPFRAALAGWLDALESSRALPPDGPPRIRLEEEPS